ncbi:Slit-like protein 1 protein [Frankliniella fusca]|uniref:Slit-like protein 1 protein n=1 Tax=Frankliniella fusca TaxID=407009 RepID=A0AAE1LU51_9NEOP|nr:Slit-like protein 1 protein [Frankliniella fusca]
MPVGIVRFEMKVKSVKGYTTEERGGDFEPPRVPQAHQPRLYVLMVFEQRPATPPNTPTDVKDPPPLVHQGPLGRHPDLQQFLGDRSSFPLTSWLRSNSPKMARIAACQQFRAHLSGADLSSGGLSISGLAEQQRDDQGVLGDVDDSEHSSDERSPRDRDHQDHDKENHASRKSKRSKLSRLRRLLGRKQHCPV